MRWFEYSYKCQCGEAEEGYIPSIDCLNIRCYFCHRFQQPALFNLHTDEIDYEDYMDEIFGPDFDEEEDWEEDEEF